VRGFASLTLLACTLGGCGQVERDRVSDFSKDSGAYSVLLVEHLSSPTCGPSGQLVDPRTRAIGVFDPRCVTSVDIPAVGPATIDILRRWLRLYDSYDSNADACEDFENIEEQLAQMDDDSVGLDIQLEIRYLRGKIRLYCGYGDGRRYTSAALDAGLRLRINVESYPE